MLLFKGLPISSSISGKARFEESGLGYTNLFLLKGGGPLRLFGLCSHFVMNRRGGTLAAPNFSQDQVEGTHSPGLCSC